MANIRFLPDNVLRRICDHLSVSIHDPIWDVLVELYPHLMISYLCPKGLINKLRELDQESNNLTRLLDFSLFKCFFCDQLNATKHFTSVYRYDDPYDGLSFEPICNQCSDQESIKNEILLVKDVPSTYQHQLYDYNF